MSWQMPKDLEDAKKEAILEIEKPLLIIAGPGSGKTMTLVERVVYLISKGVEPDNIFIATFTEKAASELITRVSNRLLRLGLPVNLNEMYIGTLHSIFLRLLDNHREFTRLKRNYRLLDQFEQRYLIFRRLKRFMEDETIKQFFDGQKGSSSWSIAEDIVGYVNKVSEELLDIEALSTSSHQEIQAIARMYQIYKELLEAENALDFSTIQAEAWHLLNSRPEVLAQLQQQIRYFMVDEYQDTNTVQEKILLLLAARSNLCVVGDDDQGLYRFRGATVRNILEFPQNFPAGQCHIVKLTTNYRSHPGIIQFYNRWIGQTDWSGPGSTRFRFDKEIVPREDEFPDTASVVKISSDGTHVDFHNEILAFLAALRDAGKLTDLNQVAFLFRSVKSERATAIARFLEESGIPVFAPRSALFFERDEVRLILGALVFLFPNLFKQLQWAPGVQMPVWAYYEDCKLFFATALRSDPKQNKDLLAWCRQRARAHMYLSEPTNYRFSGGAGRLHGGHSAEAAHGSRCAVAKHLLPQTPLRAG